MNILSFLLAIFALSNICMFCVAQTVSDVEANIYFVAHTPAGRTFQVKFGNDADYRTLVTECPPATTKISIIIHGWSEGYSQTLWVPDFMRNIAEIRGGCHLFMDYSKYSIGDYGYLVTFYFKLIMPALVNQMKILFDRLQYKAEEAFIFGFSYGAHLAVTGSYTFGPKRIGRIDVCDPAYPLFYGDLDMAIRFSIAANTVQCIHTSIDYGTPQRYCPISWSMGNCGLGQAAIAAPPRGNHGLCPYFYTSAFKNDFRAVNKPACVSTKPGRFQEGFVMGYRMDVALGGYGEYFADTSTRPTFN